MYTNCSILIINVLNACKGVANLKYVFIQVKDYIVYLNISKSVYTRLELKKSFKIFDLTFSILIVFGP